MYKIYNLMMQQKEELPLYLVDYGRAYSQQQRLEEAGKNIKNKINDFLHDERKGCLCADKIMEDWFPQVNADVFISHSHSDKELALSLAEWLYHVIGVESFIDSCVWGYFSDLSKKLDDELDDVSYVSTHVHSMLTTSLVRMIDKCECIIFLNTPNSLQYEKGKEGTFSPWIYTEITATSLLRTNIPERKRIREGIELSTEKSKVFDSVSTPIVYDLDLRHFTPLNGDDLVKWSACGLKRYDALDYLYRQHVSND